MKLKVKNIELSTGGPFVAVIHKTTAHRLNLFPSDRIKIKRVRSEKDITCVVDISTKGVNEQDIGLFEEVLKELNIEGGVSVDVERAEKPESLFYIRKKLEGKELSTKEIQTIVKDIMQNALSEAELTFFVSGCYSNGLSIDETVALTNAIVKSGQTLGLKAYPIVDKHSIGGIPGNRTTMVVVPIIAALGYKMPKTSSRAISSSAGTADTMEVLAPVTLSRERIREVIKKTNGCIVWGGAVHLAAADDKLIKIRHPMSLDPLGMMLASIMAKKKAMGATHLVIDIPFGKGAKVETKREAKKLKHAFEKLAKRLNIRIKVLLTDGSQPIGNGVGPALETADVISVLKGDGPNDLREKSILIATEILKLLKVKDPHERVLEVLDSGKAYQKFREIIYAQGGLKRPVIPRAQFFLDVYADHNGVVKDIHNKNVAQLAQLTGAPEDKTAGLYLRVKVNDSVKKGTIMFTLYSNSEKNLNLTEKHLKTLPPVIY